MKLFVEKIKNHSSIVFIIFDIFLIALSVYLAFLLRFDGKIPIEKLNNLLTYTILSILITIPIFWWQNLYRISWSYVSLTDLPKIVRGVTLSVALSGLALFLLRFYPPLEGFPRSIIFIYAVLIFLLAGGLRFSKRIYWQLIRSKMWFPKDRAISWKPKSFKEERPKTILITGGAGYIGSVLTRQLLNAGYTVKVIDKLLFGSKSINKLRANPNFQFIQKDILNTDGLDKVFVDVDAVVHLAAIVGEAACVSRKDIAIQTNYLGTVYLARLCKAYGIKRFIYSSTCSTYGQTKEGETMKENSPLYPVDFYGETKIYAERELIKLTDGNFSPTILRLSTVYGLSPRMRFDLVVNIFTKKAVKDKEIFIFGGNQYRPLIHVNDVARAITLCLEAPLSSVGNQIINVGDNRENYLVSEIGNLIKECLPATKIKNINAIEDHRSYKVSFDKIEKLLKFRAQKTIKDGIIEIQDAINKGKLGDTENKIYYNHLV